MMGYKGRIQDLKQELEDVVSRLKDDNESMIRRISSNKMNIEYIERLLGAEDK